MQSCTIETRTRSHLLPLCLSPPQIAAFNRGHGWFFWNFRTEFEPHWDFLEAYRRGWFPRNVSDVKALKGMAMCDEGALPLKPTIPPKPKKQPPSWLAKNWLTLLAGALGGALLGVGGTLVAARKKPEEGRPYLAMPGGSA